MTRIVITLLVLLFAATPAVVQPQEDPASRCRRIWSDELDREIDSSGLNGCVTEDATDWAIATRRRVRRSPEFRQLWTARCQALFRAELDRDIRANELAQCVGDAAHGRSEERRVGEAVRSGLSAAP